MKMFHMVAVARNGVIGKDGDLPWRLKPDLAFFKRTTMGHIIIMGRKTFASLGRPLPGRLSIVISRQDLRPPAKDVLICHSIDEACAVAREQAAAWGDQAFIIGGGEIYRQTQALVDGIYLTRIALDIPGDTYYPEPNPELFTEIRREEHNDHTPPFAFLYFARR